MNTMELILGNQSAQLAGWTLLHFVWQGSVIALLPFIVRALSTRQSARLRYGTACLALLMMAVTPLITFSVLEGRSNPSSGLRLNSESLLEKPSSGNWNSVTSLELFSPPWLQTIETVVSPWLPWLTVAWLCGVFFLSLRLAGGLFYAQRLTRNRTRPIGIEWQEKLRRLCEQLQVRRTVLLFESARIQVPTVIGWLRPVILLPGSALTGLTTPQLEAILAHELAHIRRHDYLVNLLQTAVETLLFYHPAVWWVSKQVRQEREHCCDDLAVAVQGDVLAYARALAELETRRTNEPQLAMAANGGSLLTRIERLLVGSQPRKAPHGLWLTGVMVVASLVGVAAGTRSDVFFGQGGAVLSDAENVQITQALTEPLIEPNLLPKPDSAPSQEDRATPPSEPVSTLSVDRRTETEAVARVEVRVSSSDGYAYLQNTNTTETKQTKSADSTSSQQANTGTKRDYIAELQRLGYTNLSVDQLIELKSHGVSIEFIEGLKREGLGDLSVEHLLKLRSHGVQPDLIRSLKASGYSDLGMDQLLKLRMHGVTPQFVSEMSTAGFPRLPLEALVKARQHGVSPAFIKDLQSLGYTQLSLDDVIKARMHGIDSNFIKELQSAGHKGLSLDELIKARQHGVDANFAKTLEPLGYSGLTLEQLIKLRNHGVNSEFIQAIRQEGYDKVSLDELIRLRNHGVNAEFIQRMKSQGFQKLSLDQLIKLRNSGM
jgi:beta-lactamase regulating signal transducer with metallopeptidase domain